MIELLEAYVDLQAAFRLVDHNGNGVMEFAQTIISDPEEQNGLFWHGKDSLVGAALARAAASGWSDGQVDYEAEPFLGYYYTILQEQGPNAPGVPTLILSVITLLQDMPCWQYRQTMEKLASIPFWLAKTA